MNRTVGYIVVGLIAVTLCLMLIVSVAING